MRRLAILIVLLCAASASAADWIFLPSTYTHKDGKRVTQYAKPKPAFVPDYSDWYHRVRIYSDSHGRTYTWETWDNRFPRYHHRYYYYYYP